MVPFWMILIHTGLTWMVSYIASCILGMRFLCWWETTTTTITIVWRIFGNHSFVFNRQTLFLKLKFSLNDAAVAIACKLLPIYFGNGLFTKKVEVKCCDKWSSFREVIAQTFWWILPQGGYSHFSCILVQYITAVSNSFWIHYMFILHW